MAININRSVAKLIIDNLYDYVGKDPVTNVNKLADLIDKFMGDKMPGGRATIDLFKEYFKDPEGKWPKFLTRTLESADPHWGKVTALNLGYQSMLYSNKIREDMRQKYNCNIPWTILLDPTSACNKKCVGCWAAEYGYKNSLSYEELESIISQGRDIGVYFYMMTGGEPLVRKNDIIKLAKKFDDCYFNIFTNGSLIDDDFAEEVRKVGNITFSISIEGYEEVNDSRRGEGSFQEVMDAMDILKAHGILFGTSICYTSANYKVVTSDDFLDLLIDHGVYFSWYFHYMPVGSDANTDLLCTAEQREYMFYRVKEIRSKEAGKPLFTMDFQNDGPAVNGCIAGGKNYFHINSAGDAEPCVFIHYSDSNIRDKSLIEMLQSPLFVNYGKGQPFNENHLKPCPMLENPDILQNLVEASNSKSTEMIAPENPQQLREKCVPYADQWSETADRLWEESKFWNHSWVRFNEDAYEEWKKTNTETYDEWIARNMERISKQIDESEAENAEALNKAEKREGAEVSAK